MMSKQKPNGHIDITPHPYNMMEALRRQGYDDPRAIADLCDNSIEAGATFINIKIEGVKGSGPRDKVARIILSDNGTGMDQDTIDSVIIVGKMRKHTAKGLGKYGQGCKAAALSMGRSLAAFSKTAKRADPYLVCCYSHDHMKKMNSFEGGATVEAMTDAERVWFDEMTENAGHGTVLQISDLDSIEIKTVDTFVNNLRLKLGQIFRDIKIAIYVNGDPVTKEDYMYAEEEIVDITKTLFDQFNDLKGLDNIDISKTHLILDKSKTFSPKRGKKSFKMQVRLCIVPQYPAESPKALKSDAGWSFLRCGREIVRGLKWGIGRESHHEQAMLRGEIRVFGDADDFFNITSSKQGVKPGDWIRAEIANFVKPYTAWAIKYRNYLQSLGPANNIKWWNEHGGNKDRRGKNVPSIVKASGLMNPIKEEKRSTLFSSKIGVTSHVRGRPGSKIAAVAAKKRQSVTPDVKIKRETMGKRSVARIDELSDGTLVVKINKGHKRGKWVADRLT